MIAATIAARVHGRYLYEDRGSGRLLVGFHGYGEGAETHFAELAKIRGADDWSLAAVQALHPFYTRSGEIVASWMTSLDRELAITDNVAYVQAVMEALPAHEIVVFVGFSQGAAMAARAAARSFPAAGLILLGGDVPPEIKADHSVRLPPVLLARGTDDAWYTEEKFNNDLRFLEARARVTPFVFAGGHEWTDAFREGAGDFLRTVSRL